MDKLELEKPPEDEKFTKIKALAKEAYRFLDQGRFKEAKERFEAEYKKYNINLTNLQKQCLHSKTSQHTGVYDMPSYTECEICGLRT